MIDANFLKELEHISLLSFVIVGDFVKLLHSEKQTPAKIADPYPKAFYASSLVARLDIKESET